MPREAIAKPAPGVHFLQAPDPGQASLRRWLAAEVEGSGVPPLYVAENAVTRHVARAVQAMCEYMTAIEHETLEGRPFTAVCYIAGDDSVSVYTRLLHRHDTVVIVVGASWLFQLVGIVDGLEESLKQRPRAGTRMGAEEQPTEPRDISALLEGSETVTEREAVEIAAGWPSPDDVYTESDLGSWAVFYDLVRLVWCHELAHGLVGHTEFDREHLRLSPLHESSHTRRGSDLIDSIGGTRSEVLQAQELHADEFSVRFNVVQILYGHDPAGLFVASRIDLNDRLLHLDVAFCILALRWALQDDPARKLTWSEATHPPVGLRYDRFRGFLLDIARTYDDYLAPSTSVSSFNMLAILARSSSHFLELQTVTPLFVSTPSTKALVRYEETLLRLAPAMEEATRGYVYFPTKEA